MDVVLTIISIICTIASAYGAYKSVKYYKKSKQLTIYANNNIALIELQKVISTFIEILKISNPARAQRGTNLAKQLQNHGENIKNSLNVLREKLSVDDYNDVQKLLSSSKIQVEAYIDSFITGTIIVNNKLVIDDQFNLCQQAFYEIQQLLKQKNEKVEEKLV